MKRILIIALTLVCILGVLGCSNQSPRKVKTIDGDLKTYYEMSDDTWECDGHTYKYRLEISGRINNAAADSTFVYLSNIETITFEQAWKAAGLSSNSSDYFAVEDAILVEWISE